MGLFSKPKDKRKTANTAATTALGDKQRALQEEEQKLKAKMERYQEFVEKAPQLAEEIQKAQRDELRRRAATTHRGGGSTVVFDRKTLYEANVAVPAQHRRMRAERRQGRLMFFVLLLTFAATLLYLYYTVTHG
jgi:hypothetical protein